MALMGLPDQACGADHQERRCTTMKHVNCMGYYYHRFEPENVFWNGKDGDTTNNQIYSRYSTNRDSTSPARMRPLPLEMRDIEETEVGLQVGKGI